MKWNEKYREEVEFLAQRFFEEDERHRGISGQTVRNVEDVHRRMAWVAIKARFEWDARHMESPQQESLKDALSTAPYVKPYEGGVCNCGDPKRTLYHYASAHK